MKKILITAALILAGLIVGTAFSEIALRIAYHPTDYLRPELEKHEYLRVKIKPNSAGFDKWGFRNRSIPEKVDMITIGDSHTIGYNAGIYETWPHKLAEKCDMNYYSLGFPGYGPVDYYYLIKEKALQFNPKMIIIGFYMGNELNDSYLAAYSREKWENLRKENWEEEFDVEVDPAVAALDRPAPKISSWLERNSLLFSVLYHYLQPLYVQLRFPDSKFNDPNKPYYEDSEGRISTQFYTSGHEDKLNMEYPNVQEGWRITKELILRMKNICDDNNIELVFFIIPTKEMVYYEVIKSDEMLSKNELLNSQLKWEKQMTDSLDDFFESNSIKFVDGTNYLQNELKNKSMYRDHQDGHPLKAGYEAYASIVYYYLVSENLVKEKYITEK